MKQGVVGQTWWPYEFAGSTRNASAEMKGLFEGRKCFDTPKPEKLISRVLELATNEGDLVLDSFAGSGTTGAVAHKMGRRWIMVELGDHCHTHVIPRLKKVIDGQDPGGISEAVVEGRRRIQVVQARAIASREGQVGPMGSQQAVQRRDAGRGGVQARELRLRASDSLYWQHGHSTERDFIYVTTQHLSADQLQQLSAEVGAERTLLVLCGSFRGKADRHSNLTVKKIPKEVLSRCEWGHDDYSLKVENLPKAPAKPGQQALFDDGTSGGPR